MVSVATLVVLVGERKCMNSAVIKLVQKNKIISNQNLYVLLDWGASGVAFLTTWLVYQSSSDLTELGYGGWLLNVMMTALFVSAAAQYYAMFNNESVLTVYVKFVPVIIIEVLFLGTILDIKGQIIVGIALMANVLFAAYRGHLLGNHKMAQGAICNATEQVLRFTFLLLFLKKGMAYSTAILSNNLAAYVITALIVVILLFKTKGLNLELKFDKKIIFYAVMMIMINTLSSADVLALKRSSYVGEFVLIKPWGQIFLVLVLPLINILLMRHKHKEKYGNIIALIGVLFLSYSAVALVAGKWISQLVFGYSVSSTWLIFLVILEHLFIGLILVVLYKMLHGGKMILINVLPVLICILLIFMLPMTPLQINYFYVFPIILGIAAILNIDYLL